MRSYSVIAVLLGALVASASVAAQSEIPIPRSVAGDKGKYFILEKRKAQTLCVPSISGLALIVSVLHSQKPIAPP